MLTAPGLTPTQAPGVTTPEVNLPVPVDAFGGAVGQALEHMGADLDQSGNRIWERAVQMQELQNRTEVDNADSEFMKQTALAHARFNAEVGLNAGPQALENHINEIENIRTGIRDKLTNPASQKMFNSVSLSTMGRYISNASNHSANEVKSAYRQGLALRQSTLANELADDPEDDTLRRRFRAQTSLIAKEKGLDPQLHPDFISNAESAVNLESVNRASDKNPIAAKQMIEDYHAKGALTGENYTAALKHNEQRAYQIIPDQIATQVTADLKNQTDPERTGATLQEREQQARDLAVKKFPDLPLMATEAARATRASYNDHLSAVRDLNRRDMNLAGDIIEGNYAPDGKAPTTLAQFQAAPGGADVLKRVTHAQLEKIKTGLYNNALGGKFAPTEESYKEYHTIIGQLTSTDGETRAKAMDIYPPSLQMPKEWRNTIQRIQDGLFKGTPQDPRMQANMDLLKSSLQGMSKDDLAQFRGAFYLINEQYQQANQGKNMPPEEVRQAGARLLQNIPSGHIWTFDSRLFEQTIPSDVLQKAKQSDAIRGTVKTDEQYQAEYIRQRYNELQQAAKSKSKTP